MKDANRIMAASGFAQPHFYGDLQMTTTNRPTQKPDRRGVKKGMLKGDFAAGERTEPATPATSDFARGERTLPKSTAVADFARGGHDLPASTTLGDFASGEHQLPIEPGNPAKEPNAVLTPDQQAKARRIRENMRKEMEAHRALMEDSGEPDGHPEPLGPPS